MQKFSAVFSATTISLILSATPVLAQAKSAPTLEVINPAESQTIYGDKIPVLLNTENFILTDFANNPPLVYGQGHIHLWLDDPNPKPESAIKITAGEFTFPDIAPGEHTLKIQLVNNNHTPVTPIQEKTIKFKTEPLATPSPTKNSDFDKNTGLVILIVVALVIIAAWWYTKEEDNEITEEKAETNKPKAKKTVKKKPAAKARRK